MENTTIKFCPECNGLLVNDLSCFEQLGQIIAWESQDPELFAVHFLTVASFNLQHPSQFETGVIEDLKITFLEYLDKKTTTQNIRKKFAVLYGGNTKVLKPKLDRIIKPREWDMTISNVYIPNKPQGAAKRIQSWAESIRKKW